ncbi:GH25 family lysozyme [Enterococcus sp. LJL90]
MKKNVMVSLASFFLIGPSVLGFYAPLSAQASEETVTISNGQENESSTKSSESTSDSLMAATNESESSIAPDETMSTTEITETQTSSSTEETVSAESEDVVITEENNSAMGSSISQYYSDEDTISLARASIDIVHAGESNRPGAHFVDVSSHNGNLSVSDYKKMQSYGITGVVVKVTEGTTYTNPYAQSQINNALAAGLKVSVYHFAWYTNADKARAEAAHFARTVGSMGLPKSVNMVIDIEKSDSQANMNISSLTANTTAFKNALNTSGYNKVYYYIGKYWLNENGGNFNVSNFGAKNIWVPQYPYSPNATQKWNSEFAAWQWSSRYYINSINSSQPFDINLDYTSTFSNALGNNYYFKNSLTTGVADGSFKYGNIDDEVYFGDWNGNGQDTIAVRRNNTYHLRNSLTSGTADLVIKYGNNDDEVYFGDWDGDGKDGIVVRRGNTYYFKNLIASGVADFVIVYGNNDDEVYFGDWDGDGKDTIVVRRKNDYYFKDSLTTGVADRIIKYGNNDDEVYFGDWTGNGEDSIVVRRGVTYYFRNSLTSGVSENTINYGLTSDTAYVGDWNSDGIDSLMVRR